MGKCADCGVRVGFLENRCDSCVEKLESNANGSDGRSHREQGATDQNQEEVPIYTETGAQSELEKQISTMNRLGLHFDTPGVDPEYVPVFAKAIRVIGLVGVISFVLWGLVSDWTYSQSPFEQLLREFGVRSRYREEWALALGVIVAAVGWYYRFIVGALISSAFFGLFGLIARMFKSV